MTEATTYPCPFCRALANLQVGCRNCGRPPDQEAAEVIGLDRTIGGLYAELRAVRQAHAEVTGRLTAVQSRRNAFAERVRARTLAETWAAGRPRAEAAGGPKAPAAHAPESVTAMAPGPA